MKRHLKLVTVLSIAAALTMAGCQASTPQPAAPQPTTAPAPAAAQPTAAQPAAAQPAPQPTAAPKPTAQAFAPTRSIDWIVPMAPGGGVAVTTETQNKIIVDNKFSPQSLVISYKPGAGGGIGTALISGRKGDTHAILAGGAGILVQKVLGQSPLSAVEDVTPIALMALDYSVLVASAQSPYKTIQDVVDASKKAPKSVSVGGAGVGSWDDFLQKMWEMSAGIKFNSIPFNSGGEVNAAVLGGQVDLATGNMPELEPLIAAGKIRALGVFADKRMSGSFKDVPTFKEAGYDLAIGMPRGIFAPPGIPDDAKQWYGSLFKKVSETPAWIDFAQKNAMVTNYLGPDDYKKFNADYMVLMEKAFKAGGVIK